MPDPTIFNLRGLRTEDARALLTALTNRAPIYSDEFTDPAASSSTALRAATASVTTERVTTSFSAPGVAALASAPRQIVFTTAGATPADAPATATIVGTDVNGAAQTETVNLAQTATSATSTKFWSSVTSITESAGDGTSATIAIGTGPYLGLRRKPKVRGGAVHVVNEIAAGSRVTNGTFTIPATHPPNGSYLPNSAANGSNDYVVDYELDLS